MLLRSIKTMFDDENSIEMEGHMAFLKETIKSLSMYFSFVGVFGLLVDVGLYKETKPSLSTFAQALYAADILICLIYIYVGKKLYRMIQEKSLIPVRILAVNFAVIFLSGFVNPTAFGRSIVSAFITFYLYTNLNRLMKFGEA